MSSFQLLDQAEEDNLHSTRLFPYEDRPYKRLTSKLLGRGAPYKEYLARNRTSTNTLTATDEATDNPPQKPEPTPLSEADLQTVLTHLTTFRHLTSYEFSLFNANLSRLQLLSTANISERERYNSEKLRVQDQSDAVRDDISNLRAQLEQAQQTLKVRKGWDVLAEKITGDVRLKARDEQAVSIEKLRSEIEELEREGLELGQTWGERREQLGMVVGEAQRLRRQIRGEKEPGEMGAEEDDDSDGEDGENARSNVGTPRPGEEDGGATPLPGGARSGAGTPRPESMGTPRADEGGFLQVPEVVVKGEEGEKADEMDTS